MDRHPDPSWPNPGLVEVARHHFGHLVELLKIIALGFHEGGQGPTLPRGGAILP